MRARARAGLPIVLLAFAVIMVDGFDLQAIGYVAPEIARNWSQPLAAFGPVFAAALAGSIVGALVAGSSARRLGLRMTLVFSLVLFGALTLAASQATTMSSLGVLRLIGGLGLGAAVPVALNIVADHSPTRFRALLTTGALCGQPLGAILGAALCGRFIPVYGWSFAFHLGGILPLLLAAVAALLLRRSATAGATPSSPPTLVLSSAGASVLPQTRGRFRELFSPEFRAQSLFLPGCVFFASFSLYIIVSWLPGAIRAAGYSLEVSVWAISLFNFGGIGGALLASALIDRYGPFKVMPALFALASASLMLLDTSRSHLGWLLSAAVVSGTAGYGAAITLGPLAVMLYPPSLRTWGAGWALGIGRLGGALGPWVAGVFLAAGLAIGHLFYFAAAAAILVALCLRTLARKAPAA